MSNIGLGSWPRRRARIAGGSVAFTMPGREVSYDELAERVDSLAAAFVQLGVRRGDRIAYLGVNDIATFECLFAAGRLGAVLVPLNIRLSAGEIRYMLSDCRPRLLLAGGDSAALATAANPASCGVEHVILVDSDSDLDGDSEVSYSALVARHAGSRPDEGQVDLDDPALVLYTSGTTGRPKGAVLSHGNITFNTFNQLAHTDALSTDTVACTAPLFHVAGLGQVTLPTLFKGGCVHVLPKFDPVTLFDTIAERQVNAFSAVPTMLQMLCDHPGFAGADLRSLRYIVYGGSPARERVASAWLERGVALLHGYGMTEASPGVLLATADGAHERQVSAGVPHFYTDLALRTDDGGIHRDPERDRRTTAGELLVRGPNVFSGYLNREDDTAAAKRDSWLNTGDIARFDDGWGIIVDRAKDMIVSGGENIYPVEVEAAIGQVPGVVDCAVIGVADERWGEVGLAFVVRRDDAAATDEQIRAHLEHQLARFKIPKYFTFVPDLPRNANGKVLKQDLRRLAADQRPSALGSTP